MPTTRPRLTITETDAVVGALDSAARRWPGEKRQQLLVRLVEEGRRALDEERQQRARRRRQKLDEISGTYRGMWPSGRLDELREDWLE